MPRIRDVQPVEVTQIPTLAGVMSWDIKLITENMQNVNLLVIYYEFLTEDPLERVVGKDRNRARVDSRTKVAAVAGAEKEPAPVCTDIPDVPGIDSFTRGVPRQVRIPYVLYRDC